MSDEPKLPLFGVRKYARGLQQKLEALERMAEDLERQVRELGGLTIREREQRLEELDTAISQRQARLAEEKAKASAELEALKSQLGDIRASIVCTEELALLQEAGVYHYRHPLSDAVAYEKRLTAIDDEIKAMTKKDGGAVQAITSWTVNGSATEGRKMVRDFSKLMLRAFNAEADNLVRGLRPFTVDRAIERLRKVADTIERLGKVMQVQISKQYLSLRVRELELTADFLQKRAEEKEAERIERERLREERKVQQEIERERQKLEKERQHHANALRALEIKGDEAGAARLREQLKDVERAIADVDYRAANIRAGYVYVISNIGSFGERMVKIGMTRRLDPWDRIRELSDASVPFNFDIHALFFSKDAVGIEQSMHERLGEARVNLINRRREFFRATPMEVRAHLAELAGELLEFHEVPEALEYRQCLAQATAPSGATG